MKNMPVATSPKLNTDKQPQMIDTLSIAMSKIKQSMDGLMKGLGCRVEALEKDLVEPLDLYHMHYKSENYEWIKEGAVFWGDMHIERTQMNLSKENYYN